MTAPFSIFTQFEDDSVVTIAGNEVTTGLWSGDTGSLLTIFTSSAQVGLTGEFYYDLYNIRPLPETNGSDSAEVQFSVAYGHISGAGSPLITSPTSNKLPTRVTYAQYKNVLIGDTSDRFYFGPPTALTASNDIYVINFQRARMRQALDPGNWQLTLSGSRGIHTFVDNSGLAEAVTGNLRVNNVYDILSGSIEGGTVDSIYYGKVYPDYGIIVLNPSLISQSVGLGFKQDNAKTSTTYPFGAFTGSVTTYQYQHEGLVRSISSSMASGFPFIALSAESITAKNFFVRIRNNEYNNTNNPTILSGSTQATLPVFRNNPLTYITTVGLYNDENELLAVGKLSKPLQKAEDKEATIRVRLDF